MVFGVSGPTVPLRLVGVPGANDSIPEMKSEDSSEKLHALEEMRQEAEKGMFIIGGAVRLLTRQEEECLRSGNCSICQRRLDSAEVTKLCKQALRDKRKRAEEIRDSETVRVYDYCVQTMASLHHTNQANALLSTINTARQSFYMRTGELSEWRQQKLDCMSSMACFACFRPFISDEFPTFLRRMDHRAAVMERELHMHPKFCPTERAVKETGTETSNGLNNNGQTSKRQRWESETISEPSLSKRISHINVMQSDMEAPQASVPVELSANLLVPDHQIVNQPSPQPKELMI